MFARSLSASLICALLAFVAWQLQPVSSEAEMARQMLGERWYKLSLDGRHLGYFHTRNHRDAAGNWVFDSEQRFALNAADPVSSSAHRVFGADPPHPLLEAEHLQTRRSSASGVRIEAREDGYAAVRVPDDGTPVEALPWDYDLADYLEFELWLDAEQPGAGTSRAIDTLDFERSTRVARTFAVVARTGNGYVVENAAPFSATRIELDDRYIPRDMRISGLFDLTRTSREAALAHRSALPAASYHIPVDRRLPEHTRISRLVLDVRSSDDPQHLFGDLEATGGGWQLTAQSPPLVGGSVGPAQLDATLQLPSRHPGLSALAASVIAGRQNETERAVALTEFVHGFLDYRPGLTPRAVPELLEHRQGDCTEFADLLTTLARSQGIPAVTIFGLAYSDGPEPAFAYHAWNELYVDGAWLPVDPTWGELRVDATHIPLPEQETAALSLLTGAVQLTFAILEVDYFQD